MNGIGILTDFAVVIICLTGIALCISKIADEITIIQWLRGEQDE